MNDRHDRDDIQVDPALDRLLRQMIQGEQLNAAQHARIQQRIGLAGQPPNRASNAAGNDAGARWERFPTIVNDDEQEKKVMSLPAFPRAGRFRRTEWLELAAVLAVVVAAVVIFAVMRGQSDGPSQPGASPGDPTPIVVSTPTPVAPTPTPEPAPTVVAPTPDADGVYRGLTIEQARLVSPVPLVFPAVIPAGLGEPTVLVEELAPVDGGPPGFYVVISFPLSDAGGPAQVITYVQTSMAPQNPPGGEMSVVELGGKGVNKARIPGMGGPAQVVYWWQSGASYSQVHAQIDGELTVELVERLVAEILTADTEAQSVDAPVDTEPYTIAETVFTGDLAVTIDGISPSDDPALPRTAPGMRYVLVTGSILNGRDQSVTVQSILNFTLLDTQGGAYAYDVTGSVAPNSDLPPGETVQFELGFQVPEGLTDFLLSFAPYADTGEGRIVFTLRTS